MLKQQLVNDFQNIYYTSLLGVILFFLVLEHLAPRYPQGEAFYIRWANNLSLSFISLFIAALFATVYTANLLPLNSWLPSDWLGFVNGHFISAFVVLFLAMELCAYVMHWAMHHYQILWRVHAVHHVDAEVDATTTHRHHPLEVLLGTLLMSPVFFLLQSPPEVYVLYALLRLGITTFSHSNFKIPEGLDNLLRWVIVTPDFHRLHHCSDRRYTDSNYGSVTPWFDYLFGTATRIPYAAQRDIQMGLEYKRQLSDSRVDRLLLLPFRWLKKSTTVPESSTKPGH